MSVSTSQPDDSNDLPEPDTPDTFTDWGNRDTHDGESLANIEPTKPVGWQSVYDRGCGNGGSRRSCKQCSPPNEVINRGRHDTAGGDWILLEGDQYLSGNEPEVDDQFPAMGEWQHDKSDTKGIEDEAGDDEEPNTYGYISPGTPRTNFNPDEDHGDNLRENDTHVPSWRARQLRRMKERHHDKASKKDRELAKAVKNIANNRDRRKKLETFLGAFAERTLPPQVTDEATQIAHEVDAWGMAEEAGNRPVEHFLIAICLLVRERCLPDENDPAYSEEERKKLKENGVWAIEKLRQDFYKAEDKGPGNDLTREILVDLKEQIEKKLD